MGDVPVQVAFSARPEPVLAPGSGGRSGFSLDGSFGHIRIKLEGASNKPSCEVRLEPGWKVYLDLPFLHLPVMPAPTGAASADELEQLFLDQHDPDVPLWHWRRPAPTLTFAKPVAPGVAEETLEINFSAEDEDGQPVEPPPERKRQRRRGAA